MSFFLSLRKDSLELKLGAGEDVLAGIKPDKCLDEFEGAGAAIWGGGGAKAGGPTGSVHMRESKILSQRAQRPEYHSGLEPRPDF